MKNDERATIADALYEINHLLSDEADAEDVKRAQVLSQRVYAMMLGILPWQTIDEIDASLDRMKKD